LNSIEVQPALLHHRLPARGITDSNTNAAKQNQRMAFSPTVFLSQT
jgi:hypothetical protein